MAIARLLVKIVHPSRKLSSLSVFDVTAVGQKLISTTGGLGFVVGLCLGEPISFFFYIFFLLLCLIPCYLLCSTGLGTPFWRNTT